MKETVEIVVNGFPPTVNMIWASLGKRRFKSKDYKAWEIAVKAECLRLGPLPQFKRLGGRPYHLRLEFYATSWRTAKGTIQRPDTPNFIKAAEDAVCSVWGWEDAWNLKTVAEKIERPGPDRTRMIFEFL